MYSMQLYIGEAYIPRKREIVKFYTVKVDDVIEFFQSEQFKKWLDKNGHKATNVNKSLNYNQTTEIFFNGVKSLKEQGKDKLNTRIMFKNFKSLFGKLIEFKSCSTK